MPPLCHGDAPVPAPAATVWCVSSFFSFFLYFGFGLQAPHPNPPSSPLPPSYHGDVPSPAAAVRCVLQDYFFSALDLVYRSHIPIPPPCHRDAPSPAAVRYVFSFFFLFFFSASDLIYRPYLPIPAPSTAR